jgi:mono/diheme cytochrome c family protein
MCGRDRTQTLDQKMHSLIPLALLIAGASAGWAGDLPSGRVLYVENCAECHGATGEGDDGVAPDIRGANRTALDRALPGFDQMPEFDLTEEEVRALHAYLQALDS